MRSEEILKLKSGFWERVKKAERRPLVFGNAALQGIAFSIAKLKKAQPVLLLTYSEARAKELSRCLKDWGIEARHLHIPQNRSEMLELSRIVTRGNSFLILSRENSELPALPKNFGLLKKVINVEEVYELTELRRQLVELGYNFENSTFSPATFAARGGTLDVFPLDADFPVRIEFLGKTIERVFSFNPVTGDKISDLKTVSLPRFDFLPTISYAEYFLQNFKNYQIFIDEPDLLDTAFAKKITKVAFAIFETLPGKDFDLPIKTPPIFHYQFSLLAKEVGRLAKEGYSIIIDSKDAPAILAQIGSQETGSPETGSQVFKEIPSQQSYFSSGAIFEDLKIAIITDKEIYGKEKEKQSEIKRSRAIKELVLGLKPGDYVIHIDHGLGKFIEVVRREDIETKLSKEYLEIEYRDADKLYVPVELSDRLTRYVKVTETPPQLAKLGGIEWGNTRRRVTEATRDLAKELLLLYAKREISTRSPYLPDQEWQEALQKSFPFQETPDQNRAIKQILAAMEEQEQPVDFLITADVGYGKTEVAIRAALKVVVSGKQVAFLCPTTILAEQHFVTLQKRLGKIPINLGVLSRARSKGESQTLKDLAEGKIDIIIGTHRLLSHDVKFKNLGLLIVDEEQRFGVEQKEKLKKLREHLDVIAMTATPIPRTLYISLSGLREIITISTPPKGRLPIKTAVLPSSAESIKEAIKKELARRGQIYFLHNNVMTIELAAKRLRKLIGKKPTVEIAHGQMPSDELVEAMKRFAAGEIDILVCSTIIENGLDLPNVNTLIVENAADFGLAQMHQLRGRVGRGERQAFAYFLYDSSRLKKGALARLQMIAQTEKLGSGYEIALRDLELRGAGNILGKEQHGNLVAVGLSLYSRLLEEAIYELRTGERIALYETTIDLPIPAYIPNEYLKDNEERIKTYQLLASAQNEEGLDEEFERLVEKFGEYPEEVKNLKEVITLKLLATQKSLISLKVRELTTPYGEKKWKLFLVFNQITPNIVRELLRISSDWQITETQAKIDLLKIGPSWLFTLKSLLKNI